MNGTNEEQTLEAGDDGFQGVNGYVTPENLEAGVCAAAVNMDFTSGDARTRPAFVCLPELGAAAFNVATGWEERTAPFSKSFRGIARGNGRFVAVSLEGGGPNDVMYSTDGIRWNAATTGIATDFESVAYGNGLFVAVGSGTTFGTSTDGITWTSRATGSGSAWWTSVTFGEAAGLFVAVAFANGGSTQVITSPDGVTWTRRTSGGASNLAWQSVTFGGGQFLAVGTSGSSRAITSPDGITWTAQSFTSGGLAVAYGNGIYIAIRGSSGTSNASTSVDGVTWTTRTTPAGFTSLRAIAYGNGLFVAVDAGGTPSTAIMSTADGITWTPATAPNSQQWTGIAYGGSTFAAVASGGSAALMTKTFTTIPNSPGAVLGNGVYSDPDDPGSQWMMLVGSDQVGFYAFGKSSRSVAITSGETVSSQASIVQCNNQVYLMRGPDEAPLYWTGDWADDFELAPTPSPSAGFEIIPNGSQVTYYQNRLWIVHGKDSIAASDILDFTTYDQLANDFNLNTGDSNSVVTSYPFGENALVVFKDQSVLILQNVQGSLSDVTATEITRNVGAVGINAVVAVGPDLAYVSDRNINLLSLTAVGNAVQHKTLPLSSPIQKIMDRVNWEYGYKIAIAYWDNKLYVSLPLDGATVCNTVVVYNFITEKWFGEWNFDAALSMSIIGWATVHYLGIQRLHAITEDGKIFVLVDGYYDTMGTIQANIQSSLETRAYRVDGAMADGGTFVMDISTHNPTYSVTAKSSAQGYTEALVSDQTYARSETWKSGDSAYSPTNSGDDYNRAWRKDYAWTVSDNVQCRSGFLPMAVQNARVPIRSRIRGRTIGFLFENTTGFAQLNGVLFSAKSGNRRTTAQIG